MLNKVELLAPAGNLEKLKVALLYGADAVYMSGLKYGMRASADNFTLEEIKEGVEFVHSRGKKIYVTMNIIPHNEDLKGMDEYINQLAHLNVDAIIVSDPGVFSIVKDIAPDMPIHLSTQANTVNWKSANFWHELGIKRIVLARELSLEEIKVIRQNTYSTLELESFIHGAMCISYSGRCLLSNYMAGRDSNRGECAHPCRWTYNLVEEKRPGEYMSIYEDDRGTYIYNSKDLCMIRHMPEILQSGLCSAKLEGRMKSVFYVACVVKSYRKAMDAYYASPEDYAFKSEWLNEICRASHRNFTTGFFFGKPSSDSQNYDTSAYIRDYDFLGIVLEYDNHRGMMKVEQRNYMALGYQIEIMTPNEETISYTIQSILDSYGNNIKVASHAQMIIYMPIECEVPQYSILYWEKRKV